MTLPAPGRKTRRTSSLRRALILLAALVAAAVWLLVQHYGLGAGETPRDAPASQTSGPGDSYSGLAWVEVGDLPVEARQTLDLIDDGGPFPYDRDGITFGNREGILPRQGRGHYREYTVVTPGVDHRGARRIVTGDPDEFYWTSDHYESFERIRR